MKKRVRIYKAPDGEGKFINKTAQFLQKAQEGGMPSVDEIGYPGAAQQSQETDDNQLASAVLTDISNSEPRERIIIKLVNVYGKDPMEAQQFVDQMYQYVEQQKQSEIDDAEEEDDNSDAVTTGTDTIEEAEVEDVRQGPTGTEMSNEMIAEDDVQDDDTEVAEGIIMRYGGYPRAQDGMEVPIQMPDVSAYLPSGMEDYLNGNVDPLYGQAWERPEMDSVQDEEAVFSNYTEPELPEEKYGGMPSKRSYVNSVLKLVKKQMGGDSAAPASAKYNDDNSDPTGANVRKKSLDKFIGSVKNQSAMALAKQQAEQQYDQMMQMQQQAPAPQYPMAQDGGEQNIYQGQDYENPMHHLALFSQATGDVFQDDQNQITTAQDGAEVVNELFVKNPPKVGETNSAYLLRVTGNPGFYNNRSVWDGQKFTGDSGINTGNSGMDIDPGFSINPATGKRWTRGEVEAAKQEGVAASAERTRMDDWIRSQMAGAPQQNPYGGGRPQLGAFTGGYNMPRGFQGMPPIARMDVRRSGWFGRPKEYSIEFAQGSPMPGMGMPGQGVGFYGYGARTIKYPATRIKVESEAASVNNKAKEEIAATTPGSTATTDAAKTDITTTVSTTTQGTVASSTVPGNVQPTQTVTTEGKTETTPVNPTIVKPTVTETEVETEVTPGGAVKTPETGIELTYTKDRKGAAFYQKDGKYYVIPDENNYDISYEVTDPKRIENIKKFKADQSLYYQYIPGKDFNYQRNKYGEWEFQPANAKRNESGYVDDTANNWNLVTNPETLKILANDPRSGKGSRSQEMVLVKTKPGYYYRKRNDGSYEKFEGNVADHYSGKKSIGIITDPKQVEYIQKNQNYAPDINPSKKAPKPDTRQEKNWTTKEGEKATSYQGTYTTTLGSVKPARYQIVKDKNGKVIPEKSFAAVTQSEEYGGVIYVPWKDLPQGQKMYGGAIHQMGGSIINPIADQYGDLQKFIGGGDENFTQGDIDDMYSKDTANGDFPMAQYGYAVQNFFPANVMPTQYTKMKGVPYDPRTGKPVANYIPGAGTGIKKIDVTKSSWLTGRPKKYTITYGTQEMDPRKQNLITLPGSGTETPESQSRRPARADMDMPQRQRTDVSGLSMNAKMAIRQGERQAYRNDKRLARHPELLEDTLTPEQLAAKQAYLNAMQPKPQPKPQPMPQVSPGMTGNQLQQFQQMLTNPAGIPGYNADRSNLPVGDALDTKSAKDYFNQSYGDVRSDLSPDYQQALDMLLRGNLSQDEIDEGFKTILDTRSKEMGAPEEPNDFYTPMPYTPEELKSINDLQMGRNPMMLAFGGSPLDKFIPRADNGAESPVVYTNNPAMHGMTQVDLISLNPGIQGLGASSLDTSFMNKNTPTRDQSNDPKQYTVDPTQIESQQAENVYAGPEGDVAMDFKTKNVYDRPALLNTANAGIRGVTGILNRRTDKKAEAKMSENLTADNLYASDPSKDRGDYDTNSGLYRLDEMGQKWNSRSKQYGGDVFQNGGMVEGDEVFMTDEEIQEFLANGGDLEFI